MEPSTHAPDAPDAQVTRVTAFDYLAAEPWAMLPDRLKLMADIARREHGGLEAVESRLGRKLQNTRATTVRDGIASIPVTGPVFRYANLFTDISGATSVDTLARDFAQAVADPAVQEIVLVMDTPGGQAAGIAEFAAQVRSSPKPVTAYVDGMAASAGYWIAAAASRIVVSKTGEVGSIGAVVQMGTGKQPGVMEIVSSQSPNKRPDVSTDQGRALIQQRIDALAQVFVEDVAAYRGVSVDTVLKTFGQGDMRMGAEAVALGMADAVGTYESLMASLAGKSSPAGRASTTGATHMADQKPALPETAAPAAPLTCESLTASHPDIAQALREQGAAAERDRIQGVRAQAIPGHEQLIESLAFDGKSTAADAALAIVAAEKSGGQKRLDAMRDAAPAPLPFAAAPQAENQPAATDENLPLEERCTAKWKTEPALREEFGTVERYIAFERATASGRARIHART